ncbi:MAG: alpha/beta hydrolase, partial [Gemmatimonadaceae bacterium]
AAETILAGYDEAIERFGKGEEMNPDPTLPPGILGLLQALTTPMNLPFTRELWITNGADLLHGVDVPVLVMIGKKDMQVDRHADGDPLQLSAIGRAGVTFSFPDNANHVFKHEARPREELTAGAAAEYNADGTELDADATSIIIEWLKGRIAQ